MALKAQSATVLIASTNLASPTVLLAASSTKTRYIRSILPYNNDSSQRNWSLEYGAATLAATNCEPFQENIAANSRAQPIYYGPKGRRVDNTQLSVVASVANVVAVSVNYDESDTNDA